MKLRVPEGNVPSMTTKVKGDMDFCVGPELEAEAHIDGEGLEITIPAIPINLNLSGLLGVEAGTLSGTIGPINARLTSHEPIRLVFKGGMKGILRVGPEELNLSNYCKEELKPVIQFSEG